MADRLAARAGRRRGPPCPARARRPRLSTSSGGAHPGPARQRKEPKLTVTTAGSVGAVSEAPTPAQAALASPGPDAESRAWIAALQVSGRERDEAIARLHELLLRAARFEVSRRRSMLPHLRGDDFDDLANQSADDALMAVLSKLDS